MAAFDVSGALIGMIHLGPLPGAPRYGGAISAVIAQAEKDAAALADAEVNAIMVENFGDVPFPAGPAAPETVAALSVVARAVKAAAPKMPLGVNVLRNDGVAALGVAVAVGAQFVRVNLLSWARLTDQGIIESQAASVLRQRAHLRAEEVLILADVAVKHSAPLAPVPIEQEAADLVERACADAVVVTGAGTGQQADGEDIQKVAGAVDVPIVVGSGITEPSAQAVSAKGYGAIVGSALMHEGKAGGPIDPQRARQLVAAWKSGIN